MERTAAALGAIGEAVVFLDYFKDLPDPRQRDKVVYPPGHWTASYDAGGMARPPRPIAR
jgi:hypothetical protein